MGILTGVREKLEFARHVEEKQKARNDFFNGIHGRLTSANLRIELLDVAGIGPVVRCSEGSMSKEEVATLFDKMKPDSNVLGSPQIVEKASALLKEVASSFPQYQIDEFSLRLGAVISQLERGEAANEQLLEKWKMLVPDFDKSSVKNAIGELECSIPKDSPSSEALNLLVSSLKSTAENCSDQSVLVNVMESVMRAFALVNAASPVAERLEVRYPPVQEPAAPAPREPALRGKEKAPHKSSVPQAFADAFYTEHGGDRSKNVANAFATLFKCAGKEGVPSPFIRECAEKGMLNFRDVVAAFEQLSPEQQQNIKGTTGPLIAPPAFVVAIKQKKPEITRKGIGGAYGALVNWSQKSGVPQDFIKQCAEQGMLTATEVIAKYKRLVQSLGGKPAAPQEAAPKLNMPAAFREAYLTQCPGAESCAVNAAFGRLVRWSRHVGVPDDFILECAGKGMKSAQEVSDAYAISIGRTTADAQIKSSDLKSKLLELNIPSFEVDKIITKVESTPIKTLMRNFDRIKASLSPSMAAIAIMNNPSCLKSLALTRLIKYYKTPKRPTHVIPLLKKLENFGMDEHTRNYIARVLTGKGRKGKAIASIVQTTDELYKRLGKERFYVLVVKYRTILSSSSAEIEKVIGRHFGDVAGKSDAAASGKAAPPEKTPATKKADEITLSSDLPFEELKRRVDLVALFDIAIKGESLKASLELFNKEIAAKVMEKIIPSDLYARILAGPERTKEAIERLVLIWEEFGKKSARDVLSQNARRLLGSTAFPVFGNDMQRIKAMIIEQKLAALTKPSVPVSRVTEITKRPEKTDLIMRRLGAITSALGPKTSKFLTENKLDDIFGPEDVFQEKLHICAKDTVVRLLGDRTPTGVSADFLKTHSVRTAPALKAISETFGSDVLSGVLATDGAVSLLPPEDAVDAVNGKLNRAKQDIGKLRGELVASLQKFGIADKVEVPADEGAMRNMLDRFAEIEKFLKDDAARTVQGNISLLTMSPDNFANAVDGLSRRIEKEKQDAECKEDISALLETLKISIKVDDLLTEGVDFEVAYRNLYTASSILSEEELTILGVLFGSEEDKAVLLKGNEDAVLSLLAARLNEAKAEEEAAKATAKEAQPPQQTRGGKRTTDRVMPEIPIPVPVASISVSRTLQDYFARRDLTPHQFAALAVRAFKRGLRAPYSERVLKNIMGAYFDSVDSILTNSEIGKWNGHHGEVKLGPPKSNAIGKELYNFLTAAFFASRQSR